VWDARCRSYLTYLKRSVKLTLQPVLRAVSQPPNARGPRSADSAGLFFWGVRQIGVHTCRWIPAGGYRRVHTRRCKSRCALVIVRKGESNRTRATKRWKGAGSINREPMDKNRTEGAAKQRNGARFREAPVTEARRRYGCGCVAK
jgi:hypothetical protein